MKQVNHPAVRFGEFLNIDLGYPLKHMIKLSDEKMERIKDIIMERDFPPVVQEERKIDV